MNKILSFSVKFIFVLFLASFNTNKIYGEETNVILQQLELLQKDIKTLEKAVYSQGVNTISSSGGLSNNNNDVLTKHLLKFDNNNISNTITDNNNPVFLFKILNCLLIIIFISIGYKLICIYNSYLYYINKLLLYKHWLQ